MSVYEIIGTVTTVAFSALSLWLHANRKLTAAAGEYIAMAEKEYSGVEKAGSIKFSWVVDQLYGLLPAPLRAVLPRSLVGAIVQTAFDAIETYANTKK